LYAAAAKIAYSASDIADLLASYINRNGPKQ